MKTKKTVIAVLAAVLVTAFIIGCNVPLDNANIEESEKQTAPAPASASVGKTTVRLNVMNSNFDARTVRPTTLPTLLTDFDYFKLGIVGSTAGAVTLPDYSGNGSGAGDIDYSDYFNNASLTAFKIDLDVGQKYTFTLTGYKHTNDGMNDIYTAQAIGTGVTADPLAITGTVNIILKEIVNGTSTGTFAWNVGTTFTDPVAGTSTAYGSASLSLYALTDLNTPISAVNNVNLLTTGNSSASIASGYYKMVITLSKQYYQTVYVQEIVHIFGGFTSSYAQALPNLRSTRHTITYDYSTDSGYNSGTSSNLTDEYLTHGVAFSTLTSLSTKPTHSDSSNYIFNQWYKEYDTTTNPGNPELKQPLVLTDLALKPITLFAGWMNRTEVQVDVSVSLGFPTAYNPNITGQVSSFNQSAGTFTITITVNTLGAYDTFELYKDDNSTTPIATATTSGGDTYADLVITRTLNSSTVNWWQAGNHIVTLIVSNSSNPAGTQDSVECTITCNVP